MLHGYFVEGDWEDVIIFEDPHCLVDEDVHSHTGKRSATAVSQAGNRAWIKRVMQDTLNDRCWPCLLSGEFQQPV